MKIYIGSDHRGVDIIPKIIDHLENLGHDVEKSIVINNPTDDYPDVAFDIATKVSKDKGSLGILMCGNGVGIAIAANKVKGIRCGRLVNEEDAYYARTDDGANIAAFGVMDIATILKIVDKFITTPSATEERHLRRIDKIQAYEKDVYKDEL